MVSTLHGVVRRLRRRLDAMKHQLGGNPFVVLAPEFVTVFGVLGLIWFGIWTTLGDQYNNAADAAVRDTTNLARAFEENTERIFAGADQTLLSLRTDYERDKGDFDLRKWVASHNPPDRLIAQMAVIDRNGMAVESTASTQRVSVADRPHFRVQQASATDAIYVSQPVLGRSSNRWTIQVTRKILDKNGAFDGIVVLSIDCFDLSQFYETLDLQQGFITLLGDDGIIRARGPMNASMIGSKLFRGAPISSLLPSHQGMLRMKNGDADKGENTISYRQLQTYPLIVMVGFADKQVFGHFRALRRQLMLVGGGVTAVILLVGAVWVDQRKRALQSRRALGLTLENMNQGIIMIDADGQVPVVNQRALELLQLPEGRLADRYAGFIRRNRQAGHPVCQALHNSFLSQPAEHQSFVYPDGMVIEGHRQVLPDGGVVQTITDVTARRKAEDRVFHLAHFDDLTGLGNRVLLAEQIQQDLARWEQESRPFAVLCLDLDGFKKVNDTFGHDVGDELLIAVGARLSAIVGMSGFVSRIGGDEFIVLSRGQEYPQAAKALAGRLSDALKQPFPIGAQQLCISVAIGIAGCPEHGTDRISLLKNGDLALYCAKASTDRQVCVFEPQMATLLEARIALEQDLRAAVAADKLEVYFQPQFKTDTLDIVGFEALVRWNDPVRGTVGPDVFIMMAEETGLIIPIGRYVLEQACLAAMAWPSSVRVAVNISPVQFRDAGLPTLIAEVLARTGLDPARLELEVTEGVLISDERQALEILRELQALGVGMALDDFGTGYASLSYLRRFPFDRIKLDKSFVQAQVHEPKARAILDSVLMLSRRLHLGVVAEGVETAEQLAALRDQGCPEVQGYLTGRPIRQADVASFLRDHAVGAPVASRAPEEFQPVGRAVAHV